MSAAPHVAAFCKDVAKNRRIWTMQFPDGAYIRWEKPDGSAVFPVWSSESRVKKIITYGDDFEGARPASFVWEEFLSEWVPRLLKESIQLGPNWAGKNIMGWNMDAQELIDRVRNTPEFIDATT